MSSIIYDPSINPDPLVNGFLTYGQLPAFPTFLQAFPPSSISDITDVFEVAPLSRVTSNAGVQLNTRGTLLAISPGYNPLAYYLSDGATKIPTGRFLTPTANQGYAGFTNYSIDLDLENADIFNFNIDSFSLVPVSQSFPTLDPDLGFSIEFDLTIAYEQSNLNRAGFSFTLISNDLSKGAEFGFKEAGTNSDYIFIQNTNINAASEGEKSTATLEISDKNQYRVTFKDDRYSLAVNNITLLTGLLRDYSFDPASSDPPFPTAINPYETQNFLFLGDNTDQGYADFTLGKVTLNVPPLGLTFTPIRAVGDLTLGSTQLGYAIQVGDGPLLPVTINGEVATPVGGWQALAVEQAANGVGFTLYWRNEATQQQATWSLNAQGAFTSSALLTPAQALFAETNLNVDLTGDGQIGLAFTPIQAVGDLTLGSTQLGYAIQVSDGVLLPVTNNGEVATPVAAWRPWAVDQAANGVGFTLYWRNEVTLQLATWSLDAQGALVSSALLTSAQALFAETNLNVDLTVDGQIGLAFTPIQTVGDLTLGSTQLSYAIQRGDGILLPVTNNGEVATPVDGWQALAVDQGANGAGFTLYWRNIAIQQQATWLLDDQGALVSSALLTPVQALFAETNLNVDLTGDGQIGFAFTPIRAVGSLTLGSTQLGYAIQEGDDPLLPVTINGEVATPVNNSRAFAVVQASDGAGFTLYWRDSGSRFVGWRPPEIWALDAQGAFVSSALLAPVQALFAEINFNVDVTGDGQIGLPRSPGEFDFPLTPIQAVGNLTLGSTRIGYAIQRADDMLLPVTINGEMATPVDGWQALAVEQAADGTGFTLYWRNMATQDQATWSLNAQGAFTSSALLTPTQVLLAETNLKVDLTEDGEIGPFAFQAGTDGVDKLTGNPFTVSFGFGGDDTLVSGSTSGSFDILIGGAGNDLYRIAADQTAVILDGGNSPNDVLELEGASAASVSFSTVDNGRHLVFHEFQLVTDVLQRNNRVVLLNWRDEVNRINTFRAGETSWSYQEVVEQVNALGQQDLSWTQLGRPFDNILAQLDRNSSLAVDTLIQAYLDINTAGAIA
jgi:uncharacterized protein YqjF (DUF2071 family)